MMQIDADWPYADGEIAGLIRDFEWSATPLGPIVDWSERLKLAVEVMLASPFVSSLVCGPQRLFIYNAAAGRQLCDRHPASLGRPLPEIFSEGWAIAAPFYARAFGGETVKISGQPFDTRGEGVATDVFDALLTPLRESDGSVAYIQVTGAEVGDRAQMEAALRESETRHRLLIESWAQAVWETDAHGVVVADSPSWRAYTGQRLEEWLGYGWLDAIHPADRAFAEHQWRDASATRKPVDAEFRLRAPDGGWRWTNVRAAPVLDKEEHIERWAGLNIDIDDRKRSEVLQRESEERFQQFANASSAGLWIRDAKTLAMEFTSPAVEVIYGLGPYRLLGHVKRWSAMIVPEDREAALEHLEAARDGATVVHDFRIVRCTDGAARWLRNTVFPLRDSEGRVQRIGGIFEDVTKSKMAGERQKVLSFELQHRVRNILATLRSIAARTGDTSDSVEDFARHFEGRVDALARTQSVITQTPDRHVNLEMMVREELLSQAAQENQITIAGPSVPLFAKTAEVLALAIHELATNAVEYGALSTSSGLIAVRWYVLERDDGKLLHLTWEESGVRIAALAPRRAGFGTELIEARVPYELRGTGKLEFRPGGIRCVLELPLHMSSSILQTDAP